MGKDHILICLCRGASGKRGDFQKILFDAAIKRGVTVRFNAQVAAVDDHRATVTLENGEIVTADLIVAADGLYNPNRLYHLLCSLES